MKKDIKEPFKKEGMTVSFENIVSEGIRERAKIEGTTPSNLINSIMRRILLSDEEYHEHMAKHHILEFNKHKYLKDQATEIKLRDKEILEEDIQSAVNTKEYKPY